MSQVLTVTDIFFNLTLFCLTSYSCTSEKNLFGPSLLIPDKTKNGMDLMTHAEEAPVHKARRFCMINKLRRSR